MLAPCPMSGCWLWTGATKPEGYALFGYKGPDNAPGKGKTGRVHRIIYVALIGPLPKTLTLDHLCRVRCCANPYHLEPVSQGENTLRSPLTSSGRNLRKTHCYRGHELTPDNLLRCITINPKWRRCRTCHRENSAATYARRRALSS